MTDTRIREVEQRIFEKWYSTVASTATKLAYWQRKIKELR